MRRPANRPPSGSLPYPLLTPLPFLRRPVIVPKQPAQTLAATNLALYRADRLLWLKKLVAHALGLLAPREVVVAVTDEVKAPTLAEEADLPDDPKAACQRMAVLASRAYQQSRAVALSLRYYPLSFAGALEVTTLAVPEWDASKTALCHIRDSLALLHRLLARQLRNDVEGGRYVVGTL